MRPARREIDPRQRLLRWLAHRDRSEQEIRLRLREWGVDDEAADTLVAELAERGLIDDEALAEGIRDWHERHDPLGPLGLLRRLAARGIPSELARDAVASLRDPDHQRALALRLVHKRLPGLLPLERERRLSRMASYLARRGFDDAVIREAVAPLGREHPSPEDFD
jgi:regulatory protein